MAESLRTSKDNDKHRKRQRGRDKSDVNEHKCVEEGRAEAIPECAVCLQTCVHPAKLPCSHIFCFLCLKGLATQSRRCAMCRQDIPPDYLDHPQLLEVPIPVEKESLEDGYQWFYEGKSGWWQYDERTSRELEAAYKSGQRTCELLIVGQLYIADFDAMLQLRRNDMSRRRRIKRDLASIPKKGIAGLRLNGLPINVASIDAAVASTSHQSEASITDMGVTAPGRTSNKPNDTPESWQNDLDERSDFLLRHHYRNVEEEDEDSDEDNTGLAAGYNNVDERDVNCDDSEVNSAAQAVNGSDNSETDYVDLETQLNDLLLQ